MPVSTNWKWKQLGLCFSYWVLVSPQKQRVVCYEYKYNPLLNRRYSSLTVSVNEGKQSCGVELMCCWDIFLD